MEDPFLPHPARIEQIDELKKLYPYVRACRCAYLAGFLFLVATNGMALLIPWLIKLAVDGARSLATASHSPGWYAAIIIAAAAGQGTARIFSRTRILHAGRTIEYRIRQDLYDRLISLDLPFFSSERTGDLLSRFANDLTNLRMLLGFGLLNVMNTVILYSSALYLMARISPSLALVAILPFPLMVLFIKRMSAHMFRRSKQAQEELANLSSLAEENVSAATVIKAYCREDAQIETFSQANGRYFASTMAMARLRGAMIPVIAMTGGLGTLLVLFIGGGKVIAGELSLGEFIAFNGYLAMLIWPTVIMGWVLNLIQRGAASFLRLSHVLEARPSVVDPDSAALPGRLLGAIELRGLRFGYNGGPTLDGISLRVTPGMRIGIAGPVGSGKTTLVRLVARLFPVGDGQIFMDGTDINRISLRTLRNSIGYVPQESFLFSRTVADNIAYGREGADDGAIREAARLAQLAGDIERFPAGYDTVVGERGVTLSGGQKQRASMARALVKNPSILILDDPLSAVDAATERDIIAGLKEYYGERTVLIVSHRLSALRECDLIVVLDRGKVAEHGSHEELLAMNGWYAAIYREQQLRAEIEAL